MKTGFTCPIHDQWILEGLCPWCEPLTTEAPAEIESKDALEALRSLFKPTNRYVAGRRFTCAGKAIDHSTLTDRCEHSFQAALSRPTYHCCLPKGHNEPHKHHGGTEWPR